MLGRAQPANTDVSLENLERALVDACARIVEVGDEEMLLFPTAEMVRDDAPAVRDAIDNERKAKTVLSAAEAFSNEDLSTLDDAVLRERLTDIWDLGSGRASASH